MARINDTSKYAFDTPSINDFVIGSDGDVSNKRTRNYRIKDILDLFYNGSEIPGIDQNNKVIEKVLGQIATEKTIADAVNETTEFEVTERDIPVFTCTKKIYIEPTGNGSPSQNPVLRLTRLKYLFKKGKGFYGVQVSNPTTEVFEGDFTEIYREEIEIASSTSQNPECYPIPNVAGNGAANAINLSGTYAITDGKDTYFQVFNVNGNGGSIVYRFIGGAGTYGVGATQVIASNLLTLEELGIQTSSTTNIRILESIPLFIPPGSSKSAVINALPTFTVTQNDLYIFNVVESITSSTSANVYLQAASYFLKRGKGIYGVGNPTAPLSESDFKLNYKEKSVATGSPKEVVYYNFDKSEQEDIVDAINDSETAVVVDDTYTTVVEKDGVSYSFIGANGSYGFGLLQADSGDIDELASEDYNFEGLKADIVTEILTAENTFTEKTTFAKMLKLTSVASLPVAPESGMVVNKGNVLHFHDGTQWHTLDMTPLMS